MHFTDEEFRKSHTHSEMSETRRDRRKFRQVCEQNQLTSEQMGVLNIFNSSGSLLIGFFATGFIYDRIVPLAPETQLLQLTLIVISVTLPLLWTLSWLLTSRLSYIAWRDNESWCLLMMEFGKVVRTSCFFLCTHFIYGLVIAYFIGARCSLLECFALIPVVVVAFHFFIRILQPSVV